MEKRQERRIEDSVARVFECIDDPKLEGESFTCDVIDFSRHGVRLQTTHALVPDTQLNITLGIGRPISRFQLRGEILWSEITGNICHLGIVFSDGSGTDFDSWVAYIERHFVKNMQNSLVYANC